MPRWAPRLGLVGCFFVAALAVTAQLWSAGGWPNNHEGVDFASRAQIYGAHLADGDVLPVWSSTDNAGFGSPEPALYHKLIYVLSGSLLAAGISLKASLGLAVAAFLAVGGCGMWLLLRELGASRWLATCGGLLLLGASYTTTNWLIRGALAELSGAMLVPFFLWALVRTVRSSSIHVALPLTLALIFWAHTVLSVYLAGMAAVVVVVGLATSRLHRALLRPRSVGCAAALFVVASAPSLLETAVMGDGYDVGRIVPPRFHPTRYFRPVSDYFLDTSWRWGRQAGGLTVQLDLPVTILCAVGTVMWLQRCRATRGRGRLDVGLWALGLLAGMAALLQLPLSGPFYTHVPGAKFLQFPWRLVGLLTPILIVGAMVALDRLVDVATARRFSLVAVVAVGFLGGAFVPIRYDRISLPDRLTTVELSHFGEYIPTEYGRTDPPSMTALAASQLRAGCSVRRLTPAGERSELRFVASCARQVTIPLAQFSHALHRVSVDGGAGRPCAEVSGWPGLCGAELAGGDHSIELRLATSQRLLASLLPG